MDVDLHADCVTVAAFDLDFTDIELQQHSYVIGGIEAFVDRPGDAVPGLCSDGWCDDGNQEEYQQGRSMRLVLFNKGETSGPVVGLANFTQFVRGAFMACTLGYSIDQDAQGQGLMYEALERGICHVFDDVGLHRVQANYIPTNERSGRLLRHLGFAVEGYARDYIFINGAWRDHILTARTQKPERISRQGPRRTPESF